MAGFLGIDHVDARVRSLREAEPFYDAFLPALGLRRKSHGYVDEKGDWSDVPLGGAYNVTEYHEDAAAEPACFVGIIEDPGMVPTSTRIAFRIADRAELEGWHARLTEIGARRIEWSEDMQTYPALFFEDPCGTKLELCARRAAS